MPKHFPDATQRRAILFEKARYCNQRQATTNHCAINKQENATNDACLDRVASRLNFEPFN